jgi:hypothetical protein
MLVAARLGSTRLIDNCALILGRPPTPGPTSSEGAS